MAHLFFSYAHIDYERLLPVFERMELVTERMIWIDRIGLQRDAKWAEMIERAIKSSYGVIFAVTKAFVETEKRWFIHNNEIPWVLERFNDSRQGKLIFPILFDDVPLPDALNGSNVLFCKHVLDARDGNYERVISELKQVIPEPTGEDYPFVVSWPRLRNFKGRDQQLVELHATMQNEDGKAGIKTAGLYGTGGIGKTQLAVEFAYRYRFYFPGGVFWLNAAQDWQREIADAADRLGVRLIDSDDTNRNKQMALAFERYRKENAQDALLVLDNVENPADLATREIAPKLTIPDLCRQTRTRLIVTTRVQDTELFARLGLVPVEVTKLLPADALAVLLDAWQPDQYGTRRIDKPGEMTLTEITRLFDYLPLPLGWMAAALRQKPFLQPAKLLDNLRSQGVDNTIKRLKQSGVSLGTPVYYEALVGPALDFQIAQIHNDNALHLLTLIAAYGEATIVPAARLRLLMDFATDDLLDPFEEALDVLKRYSLVELQQNGAAFRLHPLERDHVRRTMPDFRARLGEAAEAMTRAYRTPAVLVHETLARGLVAVLSDLRETQSTIPADIPVFRSLTELLRYADLEAHCLCGQYPAEQPHNDGGQSLVQQMRERAHHQGGHSILRDEYDNWLEERKLPHFRSHDSSRHPHDPALIRIFEGHSSGVSAVAFAPDGRTALSGSHDKTLRLWDVASGVEIRRFEGHSSGVSAVAFAPDGRTALSGSDDRTLRLWDVASGAEIRRFEGHSSEVSAVAFAPDGRTALSGSGDSTLRLWDVGSGAEIRCFEGPSDEGYSGSVNTVAFAPDGRTILSDWGDNTLRLWDVASGAEIRRFEGHSSPVNAVTFAPDGRSILSGSGSYYDFYPDDDTLRLWDVANGAEIRRFEGHSYWVNWVNAVAFAPDGRTALSGSDDETLRLWDVASGAEIRRFEGHSSQVNAVTFAPDGRTALSGSDDNTLRLWDVASGAEIRRFEGLSSGVSAVAFAPDGRTVLSSLGSFSMKGPSSGILRLWDVASGAEIRRFGDFMDSNIVVAFAPDSRTALSGSGWDSDYGSTEGRGILRLWDVASGAEIRRFEGHSDGVYAVAFAPDGRTALSGSYDRTLRLWDVASGAEIRRFEGHSDGVYAVAFAPDGRTALSGSHDKTLRLWDMASGAEIRRFEGHRSQVNAVTFAPDGRTALSGSGSDYDSRIGLGSGDNTLRLWDVASGAEIRRFEGHSSQVNAVAFAPDGRTILSDSNDKTLRLWDVASGTPLAKLRFDARLSALAVAATTPPSVIVGDNVGGEWVLWLHVPR